MAAKSCGGTVTKRSIEECGSSREDATFPNIGLKYSNLRLLLLSFRLPHIFQNSMFSSFRHRGPEPSNGKHAFSQLLVGFVKTETSKSQYLAGFYCLQSPMFDPCLSFRSKRSIRAVFYRVAYACPSPRGAANPSFCPTPTARRSFRN